jgi:ParB family chromosome partitioning protein
MTTMKILEKLRTTRTGFRRLPIANVYPNPDQPRKLFEEQGIEELAASIDQNGLLQPITVRADGKGEFIIVCGERRYRACMMLGWATIDAIVTTMTDDEMADAAIIENLQRKDITPLEEAHAFQKRLDAGVPLEELARRLGKAPHRITERTALLRLTSEYQEAFSKGMLTPSQATELARLGHSYQRVLFAAISEGRCKTYAALRAIATSLVQAEARAGAGEFSLRSTFDSEQSSLFSVPEPTEAERIAVTVLESKIEKVVDLLRDGFDNNEAVVVRKVSRGNADVMADRLALIQAQLRKLELALRAAAVTDSVVRLSA